MNREIKFRAWDKRQKQMSYPFTLVELTQYEHIFERKFPGFLAKFNDLIWMEYTGLHDKNGKEIYEGDIVNGESDYGKVIGEVNWEDSFAGWAIGNTRMSAFRLLTCKVIGNIYENGDLLNGKTSK